LAAAGTVNLDVDGQPVVLLAAPDLASSLGAASLAEGKPISSTATFLATAGGKELSFKKDGKDFTDAQTGKRWAITGEAVSGPLRGQRLTPIPHTISPGSPGRRLAPIRSLPTERGEGKY